MTNPEQLIVVGDTLDALGSDCGCCESLGADTPRTVQNLPGRDAIAYRAGTHIDFVRSMHTRLSSSDFSTTLAKLRTREGDDYTIGLVDAWATVADVLTFYQERIANESYLRTADERLSVVELGRLIGYRPDPGVAASTLLAFTMEDAAGAPDQAILETEIAAGAKVQSVPGPGETAQLFETIETLTARLEWSVMKPLMRRFIKPVMDTRWTWVNATDSRLKPGDAILFVGEEQLANGDAEYWDIRFLTRVDADHDSGQTRIEWDEGLGSHVPFSAPAAKPRLYALRVRAALFGYNALHPRAIRVTSKNPPPADVPPAGDWDFKFTDTLIDLDAAYPQIVPDSWIVLSRPAKSTTDPAKTELYRVAKVTDTARTEYWTSGKTTRITPATHENQDQFEGDYYRGTAVFAQSEELPLGEAPLAEPVLFGDSILLDRLVPEPDPGRRLIVRGRLPRARIGASNVNFVPSNGKPARKLDLGEIVTVLAVPVAPWPAASSDWRIRDIHGVEGAMTASPRDIRFIPAHEKAEIFAEAAELKFVDREDGRYTRLALTKPLARVYDLASAEVLGNVALSTHGETTGEILGNGDAATPFQSFTLKQTPLTYIGADTESGSVSTLAIRVGEVLWHEAPNFYGRGPNERIFVTRMAADGAVTVAFGDGRTGARLPSGQNNVRASYRKGIGLGGLLDQGKLRLLLSRPLGVKDAVSPLPATGAADPETLDTARRNAPIGVLTLARTVSLTDYEDFARAFAGVDKALATWVWDGNMRRVFVTVAGAKGGAIAEGSDLYGRLTSAFVKAGDPFVAFDIRTYRPAYFRVAMTVKVDPDYVTANVLAAVEAALRSDFAFDARALGQTVARSEVIAVAQGVPGVVALDLDRFYRLTPPFATPELHARLTAAMPALGADGAMVAAELLTLDPGPIERLEAMP